MFASTIQRPAVAALLERILEERGGTAGVSVQGLRVGALGETFALRGGGFDGILKVYGVDLRTRMLEHSDPRFATMARAFPIAPFFASSRRIAARIGGALPVAVPTVLDEGCSEGAYYTLMTRAPGRCWQPDMLRAPARRQRLAAQLGSLTRALHAGTAGESRSGGRRPWMESCAEVLHCIADHVPPQVAPSVGARMALHRRLACVVRAAGGRTLGPMVLAHCDLHPSNLLYDETGRVVSVVDLQHACPAPAALDLRWLAALDASAFLAGYRSEEFGPDDAGWLGHFADLVWLGLALVVMRRFAPAPPARRAWCAHVRQFQYLLALLERDRLRRGHCWARHAWSSLYYLRAAWRCRHGVAGAGA